MGAVEQKEDPLSQLGLPPGFRFHPTDQELMVQYLCRKVAGQNFPIKLIGDVDLYKYDPWTLPSKAMFGEKEWYFFSPRDRKYPNGTRPNRVAGTGYWKATGTDKVIKTSEGKKVGIKKALVFYVGKAPSGSKTNWIMHEYRLNEPQRRAGSSKLDEWVLCRIYKKSWSADKAAECSHGSSSSSSAQSAMNNNNNNINNNTDNVNYEYLTAMGGLNNMTPPPPPPPQQFVHEQIVMPKQSEGIANNDNYNESDQMLNNMLNNNQEAHTAGTLFYPYGYINPAAAVPYALPPYFNQPGFTN